MKRLIKIIGFVGLALIVLPALALSLMHARYAAPEIREPVAGSLDFTASHILAVSDVDQWATAYADRQLDPLPDAKDSLSVISTQGARPQLQGTVSASNSVVGWPQTIDVSKDGRYAYVADVRSQPDKSIESVPNSVYDDLPEGGTLTTVQLGSDGPQVVDTRKVASNAASITLSPDGQWLAIASSEAGAEIVLIRLKNGLPAERYAFPAETPFGDYARPGLRGLFWHPSGRYLAGNISDHGVAFWAVKDGATPRVERLGDILAVGETLTVAEFHPGGDYLFFADVGWGSNSKATDFIFNDPGQLVILRFDPKGNHSVAGTIELGRSPEGIAMSPDGSRVVAVNMERTYLPNGIPARWLPGRDANSLSLINFDVDSGLGSVVDTAGFTGLLPEDAVFDADGDALAVAVFHERGAQEGLVQFWRVNGDRLIRTSHQIAVARGAHDLVRVP